MELLSYSGCKLMLPMFSQSGKLKANPASEFFTVGVEDLSVIIAIIKGSERNFNEIIRFWPYLIANTY